MLSRGVSAVLHKWEGYNNSVDDWRAKIGFVCPVARATGAVAPRQAVAYLPAINKFVRPSSRAMRCVFFARPR